jgi:superfamily I DNA and RNA helicase
MMRNDLFYNQVKETELNKPLATKFEKYAKSHPDTQIFLITSPLGERYNYSYEELALIVLIPGHRITFFNLGAPGSAFDNYVDDVITDLNTISTTYKYMEHIGRPREWHDKVIATRQYDHHTAFDVENFLSDIQLEGEWRRKVDLLISLLTGSINDIDKIGAAEPVSLLEKVKKKIILFDGEQTRFIYKNYQIRKMISVQGLSGTGKTELLLHKLKELYLNDDNSKIFFTCHNIALADKLEQRIPRFFDFMMVNKQIKWQERLWMARAWGSKNNPDSGLYSYICNHYGLPFYRYALGVDYQYIYSKVLEALNRISDRQFAPCLDFILVDESQDFPEVFFEVCKKIVRQKVYLAGDVFQDIFDSVKKKKWGFDIVLNRCYRTDPRTLMFAHALGLGLFEEKKLNWFDKSQWEELGYKTDYTEQGYLKLRRNPIKRFEDFDLGVSLEIHNDTRLSNVKNIIQRLIETNPDIKPGDIAIILVDDSRNIYEYMDKLCYTINQEFGYKVRRGYETKSATEDAIYITNANNVKGLEFPYVICITQKIQNSYRYRNSLYTMLTRSFIKSFLLVTDNTLLETLREGYQYINDNRCVKTHIPTEEQKKEIQQQIVEVKSEQNESAQEMLETIFEELHVTDPMKKTNLVRALDMANFDKFDVNLVKRFIETNLSFYS